MAKRDESAELASRSAEPIALKPAEEESESSLLQSAVHDSSPTRQLSMLSASNQFLNREVSLLESERDGLHRELKLIEQSYAWKIIKRHRQWIARNRHNAVMRLYETIALWMLNRTVGRDEQDPRKRYQLWVEAHLLSAERIEAIKLATTALPYRPLISVFMFLDKDTEENWVTSAIESVCAQLYNNWELCVVKDDSIEDRITAPVDRYCASDPRIKLNDRAHQAGLTGEFVVFMGPHGELSPDALFEIVKRLNRNRLIDLIYWDDDQLDADGSRSAPFFKPDWSPDLILSMNYVGPSLAIRRSFADESGAARPEFNASQIYDLVLRAVERTEAIVHIPEVLYHRRDISSTSANGSGAHAIENAIQRRGLRASVEASHSGHYAVRYEILGQPLVSILIPTKDKCDLLRRCLESIAQKTDYPNYEIIVLDNESSTPDTLEYFEQIADRVRVRRCPGHFNFSAINNRGAAEARGEFILFLNNDTEVLRPDWIRAMIQQAQRPAVGAVGAKLLFGDGRIQHAGIVLGIEGLAGHAFRLTPDNVSSHPGLADVIRDCSAVTAACMMMRRAVFNEAGGFDEALPIDFNDVDLCLRLRQMGYLVVYTPLALLHHYESATRGRLHAPQDRELFLRKWGSYVKNGDPYYNRNLTLATEDWAVAI